MLSGALSPPCKEAYLAAVPVREFLQVTSMKYVSMSLRSRSIKHPVAYRIGDWSLD